MGGADRGVVSMYDAKKIIKGENALIFSQVRTLANKLSVFLIFSSVFYLFFPINIGNLGPRLRYVHINYWESVTTLFFI